MNTCTLEQTRASKARAIEVFGRLGKLSGVGITRVGAGYGLKVNLSEPVPAARTLPKEVDGIPVIVEVVGRISKLPGKSRARR